jgi:hypothetical protein
MKLTELILLNIVNFHINTLMRFVFITNNEGSNNIF